MSRFRKFRCVLTGNRRCDWWRHGRRRSHVNPPERTRSADQASGSGTAGRCGLTLDALGERVGLSASAVSLIETGKREAKVSTCCAREALDCGCPIC